MKMKSNQIFLSLAVFATILLFSCKKEGTNPQFTFTNNITQGSANSSGEYTITGHISSVARLDKVVLTKEGQATSFLVDEATAKNKNEYDFSYLVIDINADTYIRIDAYDQEGGKMTQRFLITKQ